MTNTACDAIRIFRVLASGVTVLETERSYHFLVFSDHRMLESYSASCLLAGREIRSNNDAVFFWMRMYRTTRSNSFSLKQL